MRSARRRPPRRPLMARDRPLGPGRPRRARRTARGRARSSSPSASGWARSDTSTRTTHRARRRRLRILAVAQEPRHQRLDDGGRLGQPRRGAGVACREPGGEGGVVADEPEGLSHGAHEPVAGIVLRAQPSGDLGADPAGLPVDVGRAQRVPAVEVAVDRGPRTARRPWRRRPSRPRRPRARRRGPRRRRGSARRPGWRARPAATAWWSPGPPG